MVAQQPKNTYTYSDLNQQVYNEFQIDTKDPEQNASNLPQQTIILKPY